MQIEFDVNKFLDFGLGFMSATAFYLLTMGRSIAGGGGETINESISYYGLIIELHPGAIIPSIGVLILLLAVRLGIWYRDKK
jgi:hypothetical protein